MKGLSQVRGYKSEAYNPSADKTLSFLNPLICPLRSTCFRDIQAGNNGAYHAVSGYDLVSGLGVPNVKALIQALS